MKPLSNKLLKFLRNLDSMPIWSSSHVCIRYIFAMHKPEKWSIYTKVVSRVVHVISKADHHLSGLERVLEMGKTFVYILVYFSLWLECGYINGKR